MDKKTQAPSPAPKKSPGSTRTSPQQGRKGNSKSSALRRKRTKCRAIRAALYLFLAFVGALSIFSLKGFLIDWYKALFGGLIGFGYFLTPPAFLFAGLTVLIRIKSKVRVREACTLAIPVVFGAMGHVVRSVSPLPGGINSLKTLAQTGASLTSGGLVSGILGHLLKTALSPVGAILFCLVIMAALAFAATGVSPVSFFKKLRPAPEYEEEPSKKPAKEKKTRTAERTAREASAQTPASPPAEKPIDRVSDHSFKKERSFIDFFKKDKPEEKGAEKKGQTSSGAAPSFDPTEPPKPDFSTFEASLNSPISLNTERASEEKKERPSDLSFKTEGLISSVPAKKEEDMPLSKNSLPLVSENPAVRDDTLPPVKKDTEPKVSLENAAGFDIYSADNPPPPDISLDEKREAAAEAHERAAESELSSVKAEPHAQGGKYIYPPLSLLKAGDPEVGADHESIIKCAERLTDTLKSFNIDTAVVNVTKGPTVTRYELQLQRGVKFSRVASLSDDIALSLGASSVRIAPIPQNNSVGIEVPNEIQEIVALRDLLQSKSFVSASSRLSFAVGKDIAGQCVVGDIAKMPHMLIAGTTGSGKSVCINSLIISLIYKSSPEEVRLLMVDPKMIELGMYNGIPHLLIPVVTDPKKAAGALNWAVGEMMRRYKLLSQMNVRSLEDYNREVKSKGEGETLPRIVIVIDELADLMFVAAKEVEESIARIAQMARAAGMHLIIATQRPSADVITGIMKANIPSRIAFAVASQIESRIILDQTGAEKLIGRGDMLYNPLGAQKPIRVQGCFITSKEVEAVIDFVKQSGAPEYSQEIMDHIERQAENPQNGASASQGDGDEGDDPMLMEAISVAVDEGRISTSMLQRRLKLGYARAARLIDIMEERGIVGPFEGSKPRSVSLTKDQWSEMQLRMKN